MARKIKIDLRTALTDDVIANALPHLGVCRYSAPCIIGAMMSPTERESLFGLDPIPVNRLIQIPDAQRELAYRLQVAFDHGERAHFLTVVDAVRGELSA